MQYADILENSSSLMEATNALIRSEITAHKRILFNENNYSEEWKEEAAKRGLLNLLAYSRCDSNP